MDIGQATAGIAAAAPSAEPEARGRERWPRLHGLRRGLAAAVVCLLCGLLLAYCLRNLTRIQDAL